MILYRSIIGRARASLRVVLLLALVPLVVFSTPGQASAATLYGDPATSTLVANGSGWQSKLGISVACNLSGYWQQIETSLAVKGSASCSTGYNISTARISDLTVRGTGCSASTSLGAELDGMSGSAGFVVPLGAGAECQVTEACMTVTYRTHSMPFWEDSATAETVCESWPVGGPEPAENSSGVCDWADVAPPVIGETEYRKFPPGGQYDAHAWQTKVTLTFTPKSGAPAGVWRAYSVLDKYDSPAWQNNVTSAGYASAPNTGGRGIQAYFLQPTAPAGAPVTVTMWAQVSKGTSNYFTPSPPAGVQVDAAVIGAGIHFLPSGVSSVSTNARYSDSTSADARVGKTSPTECAFYWGAKIADKIGPDASLAEPLGELSSGEPSPGNGSPTEPTDQPEAPTGGDPCTFDFTDPSTWASAGICQLVGLIGALLEVIAGIPAAILDGLVGLFVPDPDVIAAEVDGLQAAWEDSTIGNYATALGDLEVPTASGGCSGPTVAFSIKGKDVSWEPLNACGGAMATLASLAKLLITVGVCLFGGIALVRVIGKGFGWSPSIGGSE